MFNFGAVKLLSGRLLSGGALVLKQHRSGILTFGGIAGALTGTVLACRATLKVEAILDESRADIQKIHQGRDEHADKYSEKDSQKDLFVVYSRTAGKMVKLYAIPTAVTILSIGCIIGGHRVLRRENAALTAAYVGLTEAFKKYRKRVIDDVGAEKEREYLYDITKKEIEVVNENGAVEKKVIEEYGPNGASIYAKFFDETNVNYSTNPDQSLMFLRKQQTSATNRLHSKGHLFLSDVYEMLDVEPTEASRLVGWVDDGRGDGFVSFNLYDIDSPQSRDFINGRTSRILLDFNVDGNIMDIFNKNAFERAVQKDELGGHRVIRSATGKRVLELQK